MNTGTQAAKEAGNMVDLDSNPTKLIEIVEIGKQLLITRGALTTFFGRPTTLPSTSPLFPAMFAAAFPQLGSSELMRLALQSQRSYPPSFQRVDYHCADSISSPRRGRYRPVGAAVLLRAAICCSMASAESSLPSLGIKLIDIW